MCQKYILSVYQFHKMTYYKFEYFRVTYIGAFSKTILDEIFTGRRSNRKDQIQVD